MGSKKHILRTRKFPHRAHHHIMRRKWISFPWSKYISGFLIFLLLVSQTIRVDFFDVAEASPENYRDIVSIFVDEDTYSEYRSSIMRYARDIEGYLWGTRVSLFIIDSNTSPATIAAKNERLYYEWDEKEGVSHLVGTVLIGNIPIPMVSQGEKYFPSMYPYVDFVDKEFVYNDRSKQYETSPNAIQGSVEAEIWHGVINPAIGRQWEWDSDIEKIGKFLDKTHDFYTKNWKFSPSDIPPRVFYYDGFYESQSVNLRKFFQYSLAMQNAENIAYKRFTKYLLKNINDTLLQFDEVNNKEYNETLASFGIDQWQDGLTDEMILKMPDIQTQVPIQSFLKNFKSIINEKTLWDAMLYVHNAWRYTSGSTVRADLSPVTMTLMDEVARSTLREANDAMQDAIDSVLNENGYAKRIPIFDRIETSSGVPLTWPDPLSSPTQPITEWPKIYNNYFFGSMSTWVTSPEQCSIARWSNVATSQFGKDVLVEANVGYDVMATPGHANLLKDDTEELVEIYKSGKYSCFDTKTGKTKLASYWWWNSILRVAWSSTWATVLDEVPGGTSLSWFSQPIFSLGGMKETTRVDPASVLDCMTSEYQYALREPWEYEYPNPDSEGYPNPCVDIFPLEWSSVNRYGKVSIFWSCGSRLAKHPPRYTCITEHDILDSIPQFSESIVQYDQKKSKKGCYAGSLYLDGSKVKTITKTCIYSNDNWTTDETLYQDQYFHTIPSVLRHISPTDEEFNAAKKNGVTPSLPVDMIRYVEFLTPKGNIARLTYPNFFDAPGNDLATVRAWLKEFSHNEWMDILNTENVTVLSENENLANSYLSGRALPDRPIDWNQYVSDDFIAKVLQARNWLNPDVTKKYKQAIETSLSYSHEYPSAPLYDSPPKLPTLSDSYELAYLGLTSFLPSSSEDTDFDSIMNDYSIRMSEIEGFNISDPYDPTNNNPYKDSDKCWPPDGVNIFEWLPAIWCWMQSLLPPRILAGSCGGNTIGKDSGDGMSIKTPPPAYSASGLLMKSFYEWASLNYSLERTSMSFADVLPVEIRLIKDGSLLEVPAEAQVSVKPVQNLGSEYFSITPEMAGMTDGIARFLLSSGEKVANVVLEASIRIPLPGGEYYTITSNRFTVRVTDEYLEVNPAGGVSFFPVTSASWVSFDFKVVDAAGKISDPSFPIRLDVYDDVNNVLMESGVLIRDSTFLLPQKYTKTVGVYRLLFQDSEGRIGETTIAIQSWPVARVQFSPVSSMIVKGASTIWMIELKDALWNLVSPGLHILDVEIQGGYLVDATGEKKTTMHIDAMEPQIPVYVTADNAGEATVTISTDGWISTSTTLRIIDTAKLILSRPIEPQVGGDIVKMTLRIVDAAGNILSGFNSVAALSLPDDAWYFDPSAITITNGTAEFSYIPGTYAWEHALTADIPWMGKIPDITFSLASGDPMYITHKEEAGNLIFSIRDRYGNQVNRSLVWAIKRNNDSQMIITFVNGEYKTPRRSGYYTVKVPELEGFTIRYTDADWEHEIKGIPYYATYIEWAREQFDFLPDYNARYTILSWGDFLREGEDILYNTTPWESQSLAVSTLLDSPYEQSTLFTIFPGWGFSLNQQSVDVALDTKIHIEQGFPVLTVTDTVSHSRVARVVYKMQNAGLDVCTYSGSSNEDIASCLGSLGENARIRLILDNESWMKAWVYGNNLVLQQNSNSLATLWKDWRITSSSSISFAPDPTYSKEYFVMDILLSGQRIGKIVYHTDPRKSVEKSKDPFIASINNTPAIDDSSSVSSEAFSRVSFGSNVAGYRFFGNETSKIIDSEKNGPNTIDSLAITPETPGVGWRGNNRIALSYAAGDTVGEATKWFHTFTFVNLWDPVAHVDVDAPWTDIEGIDRTIGTQITPISTQSITSFSHRDMDADGYDDILALYSDGYLSLLLNQRGKFRVRENIAFVPDLLSRWVSLGDFQDDNYADILWVNNSGSFVYIDNNNRRFSRMEIKIPSVSWWAPYGISQFKIYDMDADGKDDVVYLTEGGELGVLYGTTESWVFEKKVLDSSLGISLSTQSESAWWALRMESVPQFEAGELGNSPTTSTGTDETQLQAEVFYQYPRPITSDYETEALDLSDLGNQELVSGYIDEISSSSEASAASIRMDTYIKSQYAPAFGIEVERSFRNISSTFLHAWDVIEVTITLKNTSGKTARNIEYLDTIPAIFSSESTQKYQVILWTETIHRDFDYLHTGDYDAYFVGRDIPAGQTLTIKYELRALPASYGEMLVWDFEWGESGVDAYGDVWFKNSTTCWADMLLWRSGPGSRQYTKGSRTFTAAEIPEGIASQIIDNNQNGTPDNMETIDTDGDGKPDSAAMTTDDRQKMFDDLVDKNSGTPSRPIIDAMIDTESNSFELWFDTAAVEELANMAENLVNGLRCGFGWGSCMSFPINWAPLAPGSAPTVFGIPLGLLTPATGIPLFSAITGMPIYGPWGCIPVPVVYPASPLGYSTTCTINALGAGWYLGIQDPTNTVRIYVTPTLTLWVGAAVCLSPAILAWYIPPPWLSPLVPGGNCIVMAAPMPFCKGDGSSGDGDVTGVSGLGNLDDTWNAASCNLRATTSSRTEDKTFTQDVIDYLKDPDTRRLNDLYTRLSTRWSQNITAWPLISIGAWESGTEIGVEIDMSNPFDLWNVVKVKNKRIAGFPDFIMDWLQRQWDEIMKALFTPPHVTVIPPTMLWQHAQFDGSFKNFLSQFSEAHIKSGYEELKTQMGSAYNTDFASSLSQRVGSTSSVLGKEFANVQQQFIGNNASTINAAAGGLNAMRAAYKFIWKLPFITLSTKSVPINVPWILPSELDKYSRAIDWYRMELQQALENWCVGKTATECANAKASLNASSFMNSINQNLKRIQEYKDFPIKLQKYVTWKQRYMSQILCNINTIAQLTGWWLKDNGIRFRKWAELYVLLKAIAESWQPLLDIFFDTSKQCGVCRNERYNAQYWKFKIISMIIPTIPVIKFPRWPNIVLDLSDVQLGINISVPEFKFNLSPIKLPDLPNLSLPDFWLGISLPRLPILPAIPDLPDLPDLPSLPKLALPNLPPPPKIPKLFGAISGALKIMKLISMMYCWYQNTNLVPEWQIGDVIANRTERQWTFSLDFLDIQFPNFSIATLKEIRVSTHVNFQIRSDFITEFARAAVKPINNFTTDLSRGVPKKLMDDINIEGKNININLQTNMGQSGSVAKIQDMIQSFQQENKEEVSVDNFVTFFRSEIEKAGLYGTLGASLNEDLARAHADQIAQTQELIEYNERRFDMLRQYIQAEYDDTAKVQQIIKMLTEESKALAYMEGLERKIMVARSSDTMENLRNQYNNQFNTQESMTTQWDEFNPNPLPTLYSLQDRFSRLADLTNASASSSSQLASGYAPVFQWIYVMTPWGVQTRLFDYIEPVTWDERVNTIDIDKDGDKDYLFLLDGSIFVKYNHTHTPNLIQEDSVEVQDLSHKSELPSAPNFFHESLNTPWNLSVTFSPASPTESSWRMEFFDRYIEWDAIAIGVHDEKITPKRIVDLFIQENQDDSFWFQWIRTTKVSRSLERVYDTDSFRISGPKLAILTGSTQFALSPWKTLYTGNTPATIVYHTGSNNDITLSLDPHKGYIFDDSIDAELRQGKVYIMAESVATEPYTYTDDMIGMPILSNMELNSIIGGFVVRNIAQDVTTSVAGWSDYITVNLGNRSDIYNFNLNYPNGYYSARLHSMGENAVNAWVILFAPQASSDNSAPVIDIPENIRIPVYSTKTLTMSEYITEMNTYTMAIDPDVTIDSNGNWVVDDDFWEGSQIVRLQQNALILWSFDTIGRHIAQIRVTDAFGNVAYKAFTIDVYAPIPQIQTISNTWWVLGNISEKVPFEPIHLFRVRPGTDITRIHTGSIRTNVDGLFMSGTFFTGSWVELRLGSQVIPMTEQWVFGVLPSWFSIRVDPANKNSPMRLNILSSSWVAYTHFMMLSQNLRIIDTTKDNSLTNSTGVLFVTPEDVYRIIPASVSDTSIPWWKYVTDNFFHPLAAIARDGNIYLMNPSMKIVYGNKDGYPEFSLTQSGSTVAKLLYKSDLFYTVK